MLVVKLVATMNFVGCRFTMTANEKVLPKCRK